MLFNGWSLGPKNVKGTDNPWRGHPFNSANNVNGVDGDRNGDGVGHELHTLGDSIALRYQEVYVRAIVNSLRGWDNVMYEISNESEGGSLAWQQRMVRLVRAVDSAGGGRHPVGLTAMYPGGRNDSLLAAGVEWISPNGPLIPTLQASGTKVVLHDTDHLCGVCGSESWPWASFLQGYNPLFMDLWDGESMGMIAQGYDPGDTRWAAIRSNLGVVAGLARRVPLAELIPAPAAASSGLCLARVGAGAGVVRVAYFGKGAGSLALSDQGGPLEAFWVVPARGDVWPGGQLIGGRRVRVRAPFEGPAVLVISRGVW
jgi:hypothetical protein